MYNTYVGARYVPKYADPIQWDINTAYEYMTIVANNNNTYISKTNVPTGIQLTNNNYWQKMYASNTEIDSALNVQGFIKDALEGCSILIIGDSTALGVNNDNTIYGVGEYFKEWFPRSQVDIIAKGGASFSTARTNNIIALAQTINQNYDYIFLFGGSNDITFTFQIDETNLIKHKSIQGNTTSTYDQLVILIDLLKTKTKTLTWIPPLGIGSSTGATKLTEKIISYMEYFARSRGCRICNAYGRVPAFGIHTTREGYKQLAQMCINSVNAQSDGPIIAEAVIVTDQNLNITISNSVVKNDSVYQGLRASLTNWIKDRRGVISDKNGNVKNFTCESGDMVLLHGRDSDEGFFFHSLMPAYRAHIAGPVDTIIDRDLTNCEVFVQGVIANNLVNFQSSTPGQYFNTSQYTVNAIVTYARNNGVLNKFISATLIAPDGSEMLFFQQRNNGQPNVHRVALTFKGF